MPSRRFVLLALLMCGCAEPALQSHPTQTQPDQKRSLFEESPEPRPAVTSLPVQTPTPVVSTDAALAPVNKPVLAHRAVDAELLYVAKVQRPKRPKIPRRLATKKPKKSAMKSAGMQVSLGAVGVGYGKGGGGGVSASSSGSSASAAPRPQPRRDPAQGPTPPTKQARGEQGNIRYLSADDSNSAASPVLVRQAIAAGKYVDPSLVRTYEFLNYHTFAYTPKSTASKLAIAAHMRKTTKPSELSVQVAVRAEDRTRAQMQPVHATLLLDTSGSMAGPSMALARRFIDGFVSQLRTGDRLSIVVANRKATILVENHSVGGETASIVRHALDQGAQPNDVTNLERGVVEAYKLAATHRDDGFANRVILISDGAANFGRMSKTTISKYSEDADKQGIYLAGIGLGAGFNDQLMNHFTDRGRGAYLFLDTEKEITRVLDETNFVANFDMAVKDVRLKMKMPEGWSVKSFHGEQISKVKSKVTPQYLAPNDQMIYHMILDTGEAGVPETADFEFEAEYTPLGGAKQLETLEVNLASMLGEDKNIIKGDALVIFAETLKKIRFPLETHREANLALFDRALTYVTDAQQFLADQELRAIVEQMQRYRKTLEHGEVFPGARDQTDESPDAVLGIQPENVRGVSIRGARPQRAIKGLGRLLNSRKLVPMEGYRFLAVSTGPVGNPQPVGTGALKDYREWRDPTPRFLGKRRARRDGEPVYDLHQVTLELTAPQDAQSFSFDFNYFSAEYPDFIQQDYNDTFYAILQAESTNGGATTNISFDARNNTIEVDNNYFEGQFHPIPNWGTGFDESGSTGWLRTSWPIKGGEQFKLTFSVHDEGDAIYDSMVLLDNFQWHDFPAVGTTDPLN